MPSFWSQKYFIGAKSKKEAASLCPVRDICLYYQMESVDAVNLPLMIVYRDCQGRVFHLAVENREEKWQLAWDKSVKCPNLRQLLNYYEEKKMQHKGHDTCSESFPVWEREFRQRFGT